MDEYRQLYDELNTLKSKLAVNDYYIGNFKEQDVDTLAKLEVLKDKIDSNNQKLNERISAFEHELRSLKERINSIESNVNSVSSNTLVQFTSSMDLKKWITVCGLLFSFLASAGIIDTAITNTVDNSDEDINNNIEKLLELVEE